MQRRPLESMDEAASPTIKITMSGDPWQAAITVKANGEKIGEAWLRREVSTLGVRGKVSFTQRFSRLLGLRTEFQGKQIAEKEETVSNNFGARQLRDWIKKSDSPFMRLATELSQRGEL